MTDDALSAKQVEDSAGAEDWKVLGFGAEAWFAARSHAAGAALIRRIAGLAPDLNLRANGVHVRLGAPDSRLAAAEVAMAREISAAATECGLVADPALLQRVQLAVDAIDPAAIMPFWRTALGYDQVGDDDLIDPMRRDPALWFQHQNEPRPLRNRIHLDVSRAGPVTAPGGQEMYSGGHYSTLADAEGNELDVVPGGEPGGHRISAAPETSDWRILYGGMTFYPTTSDGQSAELASAVADLADEAGFPLLIDLRPGGVTIDTGKDEWEDERFEELARRVQAAARSRGLTADASRLRFVQFGIDAADIPAVRRFWQSALGYVEHACGDLYDPRRLGPPIFFQPIDTSEQDRRRQRNRIHVDVFVPHDQAQSRIDAALAAGGRIAYDAEAPEWWTIADPEGNEVDIAVSYGREELWAAKRGGAD
ncbi:MAG TPA: VOC family protein [Mycobacteriales bacterium]|nr:VOC family protein [Mycobacteriales bacterium]